MTDHAEPPSVDNIITDKARLFDQLGLPEADVELDGVGTVRVRALSRYEILLAGKGKDENDVLAIEQAMLSMAMVSPRMNKADVERWQKASPIGQIQRVTSKVNELSGVGQNSGKDAYKSVRGEPEPGV
jgi:hypothetical protein